MLQQLIHIILISFFCILWGYFPMAWVNKKINEASIATTLTYSFFTGIAILSILSSWIVLFVPIHFYQLLLASIPLAFFILFKSFKNKEKHKWNKPSIKEFSWLELAFVVIICSVFIYLSSGKTSMGDTEIYHLQIIRWGQEYGLVPGLANLYPRFALSSNWFYLIDLFYLPFFKHQNFSYLNCTFCIWFFLFLFFQWKKFSNSPAKEDKIWTLFFLAVLVFMFIEWELFRWSVSSTNYDFIVTAFSFLCLFIVFKNILFKSPKADLFLLIFFSLSVPAFKVSGIPILFIVVAYFLVHRLSWKYYAALFISGLLCAVPLLCRNYIQSGYPLFPIVQSFSLHPDWQLPPEMAKRFYNYISLSNKYINITIPPEGWANADTNLWVKGWFGRLITLHKIVVTITLLFLPLIYLIIKKTLPEKEKKILPIYIAMLLAFCFWFITAPALRFAYSYFIFAILFFGSILFYKWVSERFSYPLFLLLGLGFIFYAVKKYPSLQNPDFILYPQTSDIPPYKNVLINQQEYHIPERINNNWDIRCMDTPLPCIYEWNPYLHKRGNTISKGFRMNHVADYTFILNYNY